MTKLEMPDPEEAAPCLGQMLGWIRRIVGFGTRRPGYPQSLQVEQWLENLFREFGLTDVRREPVPVNFWEPRTTSLEFAADSEFPCFPIPYTSWTTPGGIESPTVFIGEGNSEEFHGADLRGRIAVAEVRFAELMGAALKQGAHFIHDANHSVPDGPLHVANWLIKNFQAYYEAHRRGAFGFIGLLVDSPADGCDFYVPYDGFLKGLPGVWVGREHAAQVRGLAMAGQRARLMSAGKNRLVDSHNVVGVIRGADHNGNANNENIIVTCHHDAPFASAVEDASGLAVMLALAKAFGAGQCKPAKLRRDLVFVAASGHFHGGIGNRTFVERHTDGLLKQTVAAFGVEHIAEEAESDGHGGYRLTGHPEVRALFFDGCRRFADVLEAEAKLCGLDRLICADAYSFGPEPPCDSAPFFTAGIPSACHISGPLYLFDPHDTIDKVRAVDLVPVARFFTNAIRQIDAIPADKLAEGMKRPRGMPPAPPPPWFRPPPSAAQFSP
jgi:hypothetical protein